ncbi:hypothetical protein D9756_000231 [Leucocoprinus leucothites]|uniref:Uncharacterized protein n=1 Tax=Leucocoprinus leucothites TaxID=201217 RepID=A0A8H5GF51_9AGAR|nr:hypothetical protein D9756_000231 [Leucoagaricus leucothites]
MMAYPDQSVDPEFITAYTVSEAQSPAPPPWRKQRLERPEEDLTVEEIYIAPPLSRRPDYEYPDHRYDSRTSRARAPPSTPMNYHGGHYERPMPRYRVDVGAGYSHVSPQAQNWHEWRARSPQSSESSSTCSATDCEECAYTDSRRGLDRDFRMRRTNPTPYVIVPGNSTSWGTERAPHMDSVHTDAYIQRPVPQPYRLRDSSQHYRMPGSYSPSVELSLADNTALVRSSHNQIAVFQGSAWSSHSGGQATSDEMSMLHSSVSSPRWSETGQRYLSGSESQHSDNQSYSPPTSLDGLYEQPDPRFLQGRPPPRGYIKRPVIITRSNGRYEAGFFEDGPYDSSSGGYSDASGSDRNFSERNSEISFSSSGSDEYDGRDYERRY